MEGMISNPSVPFTGASEVYAPLGATSLREVQPSSSFFVEPRLQSRPPQGAFGAWPKSGLGKAGTDPLPKGRTMLSRTLRSPAPQGRPSLRGGRYGNQVSLTTVTSLVMRLHTGPLNPIKRVPLTFWLLRRKWVNRSSRGKVDHSPGGKTPLPPCTHEDVTETQNSGEFLIPPP